MNPLRESFRKGSGEKRDGQYLPFYPQPAGSYDWATRSLLTTVRTELAAGNRCCAAADIAAAIVHEIIQPLTAIVANAEVSLLQLSAKSVNMVALESTLQQIQVDGQDASKTIRDLRALFKGERTQQAKVDLPSAINEVLSRLRPHMKQYAIRTRLFIDANVRPVAGDHLQLRQVLRNLIENAVESMEDDSEWPRVLDVRVSKENRMVLTQIADRGYGVRDCETVFNASVTTKKTGMGMGLRICRAIIEAHKGKLWAYRRRDRGTVFAFSLPLAERAA